LFAKSIQGKRKHGKTNLREGRKKGRAKEGVAKGLREGKTLGENSLNTLRRVEEGGRAVSSGGWIKVN